MTDRPVIMSAPMIRASLDNRKTQTRRLATSPLAKCVVGDRLWVREAWKPHSAFAHLPPSRIPETNVFYFADNSYLPSGSRGRPSIHMPRWASRLTLVVTDVRRQRLHEMSEADAIAEGALIDCSLLDGTVDCSQPPMVKIGPARHITVCGWYHRLWDELHGPDAWDANPVVVVLTFTVHHANIDALPAQGRAV